MAAFVKVRLLASSFFQLGAGAQLKLTSVVCELCDNSRITQCVTHLLGIPYLCSSSSSHPVHLFGLDSALLYLPHTLQPLLCDSDSCEVRNKFEMGVSMFEGLACKGEFFQGVKMMGCGSAGAEAKLLQLKVQY